MTEPERTTRTASEELKTLRKRIAELEALKLDQDNTTKLLQPENEGIYKAVFESSNDSILLIDKKGKILDFNERLIKISGYQKEELIGKNISSLAGKITKKSLAIITSNFLKRIAGLHVSPYEVELLKKNGELLSVKISAQPLKKDGKIIGDLVLLHNVTDRKKAEDELRFKGELLDACSDSLLWYDDDGTPLYVNEAACRAHGYTHDEMMRIKLRDLIVPEYGQQVPLKIEELRNKGDTILESAHYRKDGSILPLEIHAHVFKWDGKEFAFSICRDITERKQAEEALKISEQNFRNSIDTSPMGIRITDIDDQTLYLNQAFLKIFGYKNIDEVRMKPPLEHYTPESFAGFLQRKEKRLRGELCPEEVEIDIIREDGTVRHIQIFPKILIWNGKQQFQTIYNDVTERKQLEQALKESEEKYRMIVENSQDIIFTLREGIFIYVSPSVKQMLGYNQADLRGKPFMSLVHPDDKHIIEDAIRNGDEATNQTTGGHQYRFRHASGEWRWYSSKGTKMAGSGEKSINFIGIGNDITVNREAELQIREQKAFTDRVLENTTNAVIVVGPDRRVMLVNKAFENTFLLSKSKVEGKEIEEIVPDSRLAEAITQVLTSGKSQLQVEFRIKRVVVEKILIADIIYMQKNEVLTLLRDITDEREMQERLYLTDRLASVGQMAAGIAHELNNPLTGVVAFYITGQYS